VKRLDMRFKGVVASPIQKGHN